MLIKFGVVPIYAYGFFTTLGFLGGLWLAMAEARRVRADRNRILDLALCSLIAGLVGARSAYILLHIKSFAANPSEIFNIWDGGLIMIGGGVMVYVVAIFYLRKRNCPVWMYMDIAAPAVVVGYIFSRIGCFLAGCDYGKPTSLPWGVVYTHPLSYAPRNIPLHPTQVYDILSHLILLGLLWLLRKRKTFQGQIFWLFILSHGLLRLIFYRYRGNDIPVQILGGMTGPQFVGALIALAAAVMYRNLKANQTGD